MNVRAGDRAVYVGLDRRFLGFIVDVIKRAPAWYEAKHQAGVGTVTA